MEGLTDPNYRELLILTILTWLSPPPLDVLVGVWEGWRPTQVKGGGLGGIEPYVGLSNTLNFVEE